jgi:hypothetical protein
MADTNATTFGLIPEVTFGTTPAAPLQFLRRTGGTITPTQGTIRSDEIRSDLKPGRAIRTSQMAEGSINVDYSSGSFDTILEGLFMSSWAIDGGGSGIDTLVPGTTKKSYTFAENFSDLSNIWRTFKGTRIASASMSFALDQIVSGSIGVMSAIPSVTATANPGSGTTAATATQVWNTVDFITQLDTDAGALPTGVVGVDLTFTRNLRAKRDIREINPFDIGTGRLLISGSLQMHFVNTNLATAWQNFASEELAIKIEDGVGNEFTIELPRIKFIGDADVSIPGPDDDCILTLNFEAEPDNTGDYVTLTRTLA